MIFVFTRVNHGVSAIFLVSSPQGTKCVRLYDFNLQVPKRQHKIWVWVNTYRYIFSGLFTSINPSYDLGFTARYQAASQPIPIWSHMSLKKCPGSACSRRTMSLCTKAGLRLWPLPMDGFFAPMMAADGIKKSPMLGCSSDVSHVSKAIVYIYI